MHVGLIGQDMFFSQLIEQSNDLIQGLTLDGMVTYSSPSFSKLLGIPAASMLGSPGASWIHRADAPAFYRAFAQLTRDLSPFVLEYRYVRHDGTELWVQGKASVIYAGDAPVSVGLIARDISGIKREHDNLTRMAYYDALTGLPNRRLFHDRYKQAMIAAKRHSRQLAVLYLDLDDFKLINDRYGHSAGDEVLRILASRLTKCVRASDMVCRLGGDEFIIVLPQLKQADDVHVLTRRIAGALNDPLCIAQQQISVTCSIGAAIYPRDATDGMDLIDFADHAMYQAKTHGKNYMQI
ncbi:sensor domain-containing protein [Paenibacillus xerothermodurans]|uniref:Diguanylate cyclase n=1 Tax=Paenibacillus xerothermodurans TaxID=1977292 RepID=A0A2W1N5F5_PAEXE|nr:sensor domain-containing diguanylate cyclase [Paenibacillus xerothermodurans]PZE19939.1 diguanylate cyclase [Paenibacillus xerothermodurans]